MRPLFFARISARIRGVKSHGSLHLLKRVLGAAHICDRSIQEGMLRSAPRLSRQRQHLYCRARDLISDSESTSHERREEWTRITANGEVSCKSSPPFARRRFSFAYRLGRSERRRQ